MQTELVNIRNLSFDELKSSMAIFGEKSFRAKQVFEWLWQKNATSFDEMSNLSVLLRHKLNEHYFIDKISLDDQQIS